MPTIPQGSSADITVSADSTLTLQNPGGYCRVENPIGTVIREGGAASWPVDVTSGTVRITAITGWLFYELTTDPQQLTLTPSEVAAVRLGGAGRAGVTSVMLVGDSNTSIMLAQGPSVTAIADNGNGTATVTLSSSHNFSVGQTITVNAATATTFNVFNATVISQQNTNPYTVTYSLGGRVSPVTSELASDTDVLYPMRHSALGYGTWLQALQAKPLQYVLAAAGGADSTQVLTLYQDALAEANAAKVTDVIVMAGTNDIYARGWDFATTRANLQALIDYVVASTYARIWWLTVLPMGSSSGVWSAGKQIVHSRINRWIWRYAHQIGVTPVDSWKCAQQGATIVNPAASNPDPTTGYLGADATHTTNLGALAIARSLNTLMQQATALQALQFQGGHSSIQNQNNVLTNSSLSGTGGTKTAAGGTIIGSAPDGWTVEITAGTGTLTLTNPARTVAADGDASGRNLGVVPSVSATTWRLINTTSLHSAVTEGAVYEASIPITITSPVALTGIEFLLFGANSTMGNTSIGMADVSQAMTGDFSGTLRIPRWTCPSGLTSLSLFVRFTGATGGTFLLGKPTLELIE